MRGTTVVLDGFFTQGPIDEPIDYPYHVPRGRRSMPTWRNSRVRRAATSAARPHTCTPREISRAPCRSCEAPLVASVEPKPKTKEEMTMRFMMLMYPGQKAETGVLPDPKVV